MEKEIEPKQAWEILARVCMNISATRQEHQVIDKALAVLKPKED